MFRSSRATKQNRSGRSTLDAQLRALPDDVVTYIVGGVYFVVAPTGLFVVAENAVDIATGAAAAATGADRIRAMLSDKVPFVPFVDAIVVSDVRPQVDLPALVVPSDLIGPTILNSPITIDTETLDKLRLLDYEVLR